MTRNGTGRQSHGQLTARQQRFVLEYTRSGNAAQAARDAGCSDRSARVTASKWLTKPNIHAAVEEAQALVAARTLRTAADISRAMWAIIDDPTAPPAARVQAAALEAKRFREYSDRHEVAHTGVVLRYTPPLSSASVIEGEARVR